MVKLGDYTDESKEILKEMGVDAEEDDAVPCRSGLSKLVFMVHVFSLKIVRATSKKIFVTKNHL